MASGLGSTLLSALQASLSVLLVISYGGIAAHYNLLTPSHTKAISKICVKMFLPALLLVKIGSELHAGSVHRYGLILLWAFVAHLVSFVVGVVAHLALGFPDWITAALMFNNTTSYPLLLIQSLHETGILSRVVGRGEDTALAIERAKSYFLVFATVSSCLTFAVGPRLIDTEHAPDAEDKEESVEYDGGDGDVQENGRSNEETGLLSHRTCRDRMASVVSITFFPSPPKPAPYSRRPYMIPRPRWHHLSPRAQWWLLFLYDFLNAPLLGAVLGAIIGLTPPLHRAFFSTTYDGGIFTAWLTQSWKNIGSLFVPLPLVVAGISLYTAYQETKAERSSSSGSETGSTASARAAPLPWPPTIFILVIRFIIWPIISISLLYALAKAHLLGDDPMLWFAMMLMPTGPPAMKLITMVQVSDAGVDDERKIAKILTISYIISPILAFTVVGSLGASEAALRNY
jgi:predicted permease